MPRYGVPGTVTMRSMYLVPKTAPTVATVPGCRIPQPDAGWRAGPGPSLLSGVHTVHCPAAKVNIHYDVQIMREAGEPSSCRRSGTDVVFVFLSFSAPTRRARPFHLRVYTRLFISFRFVLLLFLFMSSHLISSAAR